MFLHEVRRGRGARLWIRRVFLPSPSLRSLARKNNSGAAQSWKQAGQTDPPDPHAAPADKITRTGVIERRVAIGGETTGWVLRDEKGKKIELSLPPAASATIREGMHVVIKGKLGTKKYVERGEVSMFHVREISEIVH